MCYLQLTCLKFDGFSVLWFTVQSVPVTNKVWSLNITHGEMYSMKHYVIKLVGDLRQVSGFFSGTPVSSTIKSDHHVITEILLKVVLNAITLTLVIEYIHKKW